MAVKTKTYIVRLVLWIAAIAIVSWPLYLARLEIGDIAYVAAAAMVLLGCHWLGLFITKRMDQARVEPRP